MFLASSTKPIDSNLSSLAEQIEEQNPGLSVLAARQFRFAIRQTPLEVATCEPREFNVLEEFILRAGVEFEPAPTLKELADLLGLDEIFVKTTAATLVSLESLEVAENGQIAIAPQGRDFFDKGAVSRSQIQSIYAISDPLNQTLTFKFDALAAESVNLPDLADLVSLEHKITDLADLSIAEIQPLIQASGLGIHVPENGKIVSKCDVIGDDSNIWQTVSILVLFDAIENQTTIQARQGKQILETASNFLNELESQEKLSLNDLCQLTEDVILQEQAAILAHKNQEVAARLQTIQEKALETVKENSTNPAQNSSQAAADIGTVVLLRDSEIRPDFIKTLKSAQQNIFIYSPWVTPEVADSEFIKILQNLADRGVWTLIGHGIARKQEEEDRPVSPELEDKLRQVKTPEGLSAVQIFWLGNSHVKEVIVDAKIHLSGSHNWLSYRGDRLPRGETTYKVTIPDLVREAGEYMANRFQSRALQVWKEAVANRDVIAAEKSFCLWGALGMEAEALQQLQQENWLELYPIWLKLVCQGLRSKKISPLSDCLGEALGLLSQISAEDANIEPLREGWQQVVAGLAIVDRTAAVTLLNGESWAEFLRLGIAESVDSPEEFVSKYIKSPTGKQPLKKKRI
jgi:chorismate mutase